MTELVTSPKINDSVKRFGFENYLDTQKEINEFYKFLCEKHNPWDLSVYNIRGELSKLYDVEIIDLPLTKTLEFDHKEFNLLQGKLERIQSIFSKVRDPTSNVLFGFLKEMNTSLHRTKFKTILKDLNSEKLNNLLQKIEAETNFKVSSYEELQSIIDLKLEFRKPELKSVPEFLIDKQFEKYHDLLESLKSLLKELYDTETDILEKVKPEFIDDDTAKSEKIFKETSFIGGLFNKEYKEQKENLSKYAKEKIKHNIWLELFENKNKYHKQKKELVEKISYDKTYCQTIGDCHNQKLINQLYNFANKLSEIYENAKKLDSMNHHLIVAYSHKNKDEDIDIINDLSKVMNQINKFFENQILTVSGSIEEYNRKIDELNNNFDYLNDILFFKDDFTLLKSELQTFLKEYGSKDIKSKFIDVFLKAYYLQVMDKILEEKPVKEEKEPEKPVEEKPEIKEKEPEPVEKPEPEQPKKETEPEQPKKPDNTGDENG